MAVEIAAKPLPEEQVTEPTAVSGRLSLLDATSLRLLACTSATVLAVGLLILIGGASERKETLAWVFAFALGVPLGLALAAYQARVLTVAAPAAAARGLAGGLALLSLAFLLRKLGSGDSAHHALLVGAALGAGLAPLLAARRWRDPGDRAVRMAHAVSLAALGLTLLLFLPAPALRPAALLPALALTGLGVLSLRLSPHPLSGRWRRALDLCFCALLVSVVVQLPDISAYAANVTLHHGFFLGPANDVAHGRAMLGDAWSQYGTGVIDALGLVFEVVPIGFGTLALTITFLTALQYVCVYAILRLAAVGQAIAAIAIVVAAMGNLFMPLETYVAFPSVTPLRFGIPYLMVLCAVAGARWPARATLARAGVLVCLALGAVWSFETFVYCAATYGALALVEALAAGARVWRRLLWSGFLGFVVSVEAVLLFSLFTLTLDGNLDWGPYVEYVRLYSSEGFSQLPVDFFSAGPLMAAAIFASAVTVLWLARGHPRLLAAPMRAALAGLTGFAIATFTYYLGRSHPNNLLVLLVPVVALGALWIQVLAQRPRKRWNTTAIAALMLAAAMIVVAAWPSFEQKKGVTALGLAVPGGGSLRSTLNRLTSNPVLNPAAPAGAALLDAHLPPGAPALVLAQPDLTTEILMRSGRRNELPISHPPEDDLIGSSADRVRAASERVPAGSLLLLSPDLNELEQGALAVLRRRFELRPLEAGPYGLELTRLALRPAIVPAQ